MNNIKIFKIEDNYFVTDKSITPKDNDWKIFYYENNKVNVTNTKVTNGLKIVASTTVLQNIPLIKQKDIISIYNQQDDLKLNLKFFLGYVGINNEMIIDFSTHLFINLEKELQYSDSKKQCWCEIEILDKIEKEKKYSQDNLKNIFIDYLKFKENHKDFYNEFDNEYDFFDTWFNDFKNLKPDNTVYKNIKNSIKYWIENINSNLLEIHNIEIELKDDNFVVTITTPRPGILIGKGGSTLNSLENFLYKEFHQSIKIEIKESKIWN